MFQSEICNPQSFDSNHIKKEEIPMKKIVETDNAPAAIGPYSQAIQFSGLLFVSGQIAIDPKTGEFVEDIIQNHTRDERRSNNPLRNVPKQPASSTPTCRGCSCPSDVRQAASSSRQLEPQLPQSS